MSSARSLLRSSLLAALVVLFGVVGQARALPISFNDFSFESGAPVTIAADGSTAAMAESPSLAVVYLSNLPALGDAEVIVAGANKRLIVDYSFTEPAGNDDSFQITLVDANGDPIGPGYEFSTSSTSSGSVQFDLSSLVGTTLGLQFALAAELSDELFTSTVTLSNLRTQVPGPETLPLLLTGLAALIFVRSAARPRAT